MSKQPRFVNICAQIKQMSNFQQLKTVVRGSETQLQVGENLSKLTRPDEG